MPSRINLSEQQQARYGKFFWRVAAILIIGLFGFLTLVLMMRVNYKVRKTREVFRETIGRVGLILIILFLLLTLGIWLINVITRPKDDTTDQRLE